MDKYCVAITLLLLSNLSLAQVEISLPQSNYINIMQGSSKNLIISGRNIGSQTGSYLVVLYDYPFDQYGTQIIPAAFALIQTPDCNGGILIDMSPIPNTLLMFGVNDISPGETKECEIIINNWGQSKIIC